MRLRVCPVAIAAAICTGDYASYAEIDAYLKGCVKAGRGSDVTAYAELALSVAAVCVIIPGMAPDWLKEGDFSALPAQARLDALYMRVKYLQCLSKDEAMLAAAQTGLSFCASEQGVTFFELYLRLMCAVACYTLGRADEARRRLLETMRLCLPNGFISLFAEYLTPLGGSCGAVPGAVVSRALRRRPRPMEAHVEELDHLSQPVCEGQYHAHAVSAEYHIALLVRTASPTQRLRSSTAFPSEG